jgi:hypothetical protein
VDPGIDFDRLDPDPGGKKLPKIEKSREKKPRLFGSRSFHLRHQKRNPAPETVPLIACFL